MILWVAGTYTIDRIIDSVNAWRVNVFDFWCLSPRPRSRKPGKSWTASGQVSPPVCSDSVHNYPSESQWLPVSQGAFGTRWSQGPIRHLEHLNIPTGAPGVWFPGRLDPPAFWKDTQMAQCEPSPLCLLNDHSFGSIIFFVLIVCYFIVVLPLWRIINQLWVIINH